MAQSYSIYENWMRDRGRIHKAECTMCNNGRGTQPTDSGRNGRWHGPFDDRAFVFKKAASLNRADMRPRALCKP
jgi:hypothetical protein